MRRNRRGLFAFHFIVCQPIPFSKCDKIAKKGGRQMKISEFDIQGAIDQATRCQHYHTGKDIIAIRFYCCNRYFPCHLCHEAYGCGKGEVWPCEKFNEKAILCGSCKTELTINQYINSDNTCPNCQASFNSGCSLHYHLYFEHFHPSCPFGDDG